MVRRSLRLFAFTCLVVFAAMASEHAGQVTFNGLPIPGAAVTAIQNDKKLSTVTDARGVYVFPELSDGKWTITVQMFGFATGEREITARPKETPAIWELKLLPVDQIHAVVQQETASKTREQPQGKKTQASDAEATGEDLTPEAANGFLINGSTNNGAASPFAQAAAFGNYRFGGKGLYNGGIGMIFGNSVLDAKPFSLTGQNTPKPMYSRITGIVTLGGPLRIPRLIKNGPNFFLGYQWTGGNNAAVKSALVPDAAERQGSFPASIRDPLTGAPFPGNAIPQNRISPQARALLGFYPLPNFESGSYNYEIPLLNPMHQDALQSRISKMLNATNQVWGRVALQSKRSDEPNLFGFFDTTDTLGINSSANWWHRVNSEWSVTAGFDFSRFAAHVTPYFENRENVSGAAGVLGNDQDPRNWGPPSLTFASGIATMADAQSSFNRNQTSSVSYSMLWNRGDHNVAFGGDFRRQQFNVLSQQDPRGSFTFTGGVTGSDFADFLLGIPDTSSIAFGNADKYFRESVYDAYIDDDWRMAPEFTINAGLRWEYGAPITERYGRLVNLDVVPGFAAVQPVLASDPAGPLTGIRYPSSLVRPDKNGFEPRVGIAWRPKAGSSLVIRAGYGVYYDTSVYQGIALEMAQQPPLSKTLNVQNSALDPLSLANGFSASPSITPNSFGIDPNFRIGYAQDWQLSVQRDLPGALQLTTSYLGIKETRGVQDFLPNTFPIGAENPCPTCPAGFAYLVSNGNLSREAAQIQLRRRLRSGLAGIVTYTFSKSIDDDASLGGEGASGGAQITIAQNSLGPANIASTGQGASTQASPPSFAIAQNWLDLNAERGLSAFDQRHLVTLQLQYTTGMGLNGGTLLSRWKGALWKGWTFAAQVIAGSGLPETPIYLAPVPGTGMTGTIRPEYTGAPLYSAAAGFYLNPAAYIAPLVGEWGNAGRDSIIGPAEFGLNASMGRTFRLSDRFNLDLRVDSTNALNHVTFTAWNTTINNAQFGLPVAANAMRSMQTTVRLRF